MMNHKKYDVNNVDYQKCQINIGSKFDLVLIASARARELSKGHGKKVKEYNSHAITALREIERGLVGIDYLKKI